jgi:hypothetical protein
VNQALAEDDYVAAARAYVEEHVVPILSDAVVVDAITAQNAKFAGLQQADIDALDAKWRAEVDAADKPMIDETLSSPLSKLLIEQREKSNGAITELFVTDNKGLNVGQSDPTSDYWQGDEAKWQKSFQVGPGTIFVDEVEKDESTQQLQTQVSATISDPKTGAAIGAITIGLNVDGL